MEIDKINKTKFHTKPVLLNIWFLWFTQHRPEIWPK